MTTSQNDGTVGGGHAEPRRPVRRRKSTDACNQRSSRSNLSKSSIEPLRVKGPRCEPGHATERGDHRAVTARRPAIAAPCLEAQGPNEVWTWDITRLAGPYQGKWYFLYVMLDLFSRYIVGWMIAERENARLAQRFIRETVNKHLQAGQELTIHSDRGAPMTAGTTQELLMLLGVNQSFSRPRTSDDNPYSESQFRTAKYHWTMPPFFETKEAAIAHFDQFMTWYNEDHMHVTAR